MIKKFCDLCGKEITNENYVSQTLTLNWDLDNSADSIICKKCWEAEKKKFKKKKEKIK